MTDKIQSLNELEGVQITREQCLGMLSKIDVTIHNLLVGNGEYGAVDIREGQHESKPSLLLDKLYAARRMYQDVLDQIKDNENAIILSQWDNPDIPGVI